MQGVCNTPLHWQFAEIHKYNKKNNTTMEGKKLTRPQNNKMLAGVCAGIANYFGLDPYIYYYG